MRKTILRKILAYSALALLILQSCKDDSSLTKSLPIPDQSFVEEFDTIGAAASRGWKFINRSEPIGPQDWVQGQTGNQINSYTAYSSKATNQGFISNDYSAAYSYNVGQANLSTFVVSPSVILQNGDRIVFYTRESDTISRWGDRLQVCYNNKDDNFTNLGRGLDAGDYSTVLLDINPSMASGYSVFSPIPPSPFDPGITYYPNNAMAYPRTWTRFDVKVTGLSAPMRSRFAFRYFIPGGGAFTQGTVGGRGSDISIDSVAFISASHK